MATYRVPAGNVEGLQARIDALNKRAKRLKQAPITFAITGWEASKRTHEITGVSYERSYALVEVEGTAPRLGGWRFVAKIEPTEAGNIVKALPGETAPEWARTVNMICEHCGKKRARSEVFIVAHEDGRVLTVGRQCLADFLGHADPNALAKMAEWDADLATVMDEAEGERWHGGSAPLAEDAEAFVATVAAVARTCGYVSRRQAEAGGGVATAQTTWDICMSAAMFQRFKEDYPDFAVEDRDVALATTALDWARKIEPRNDYEHNLRVTAHLKAIDARQIGIAASIIDAYRRTVEREMERARERAALPESSHVGAVGQRLDLIATVTYVREFDGDYGVRTLIKMRDDAGNDLVWWASGAYDVQQGERLKVRGTVKGFDEYQGRKQTTLTRCKIEDAPAQAA